MKFTLIDYQPHGMQINRDQTGTFGSHFESEGLLGNLLSKIKTSNVRLPVLSYSYASALLRSAGHDVNIAMEIPDDAGDVAIFATVMYHWKEDLAFLKEFKRRHPATKLGVIGGFSQVKHDLYKDVVDFNIKGEIEPAILAFLSDKWNWEGAYESSEVINLDDLPIPDWDGFPIERYSYRPVLGKNNFCVVQSSRGCAMGCSFCPYLVTQGRNMRFRDPAKVEEEIRYLATSFGVRSILFRDILFGVPRKRAVEIAERIGKIGLGIEWACEMHVNSLEDALIDIMAANGLKSVNLGIESGDPETLEGSGKKSTELKHIYHVINKLHSKNVVVQAFYILGLWRDTKETMKRTLELAYDLNTISAQFCVATPFPGTQFFEESKDSLLHTDWSRYSEYEPVMTIAGASTEDIINARNTAYRTYYIRPRWLLKYGLSTFIRLFIRR